MIKITAGVKEFIVDIENKLLKTDIEIIRTKLELEKYDPENKDRLSKFCDYKSDLGIKEQNHDLAAIDHIKQIRTGNFRKIENCQAFFLTSDLRLAKFNLIEDKHREKETITEVISDRLLTNILWLKNPAFYTDNQLTSIILMQARQLFIEKKVWLNFLSNLLMLREKKEISNKDISILLYDKEIEKILMDKYPEDSDLFEIDGILEYVEQAKIRFTENQQKVLNKQKKEYEEILKAREKEIENIQKKLIEQKEIKNQNEKLTDQRLDKLEMIVKERKEKEEAIIEAINLLKMNEEKKAKRLANSLIWMICAFISIIIFLTSILIIRPVLTYWNIIEPISWIISVLLPIVLLIVGKKYDPFYWRTVLRKKLYMRIYKNKLNKFQKMDLFLNKD